MTGWSSVDVECLRGLKDGGLSNHIEIYDYTQPNWGIPAVRAWDHNQAAAKYVAARIATKVHEDPSARIVVVGWSAGCAVALWTLESLPDDMQVQSVLLIEADVSPGHDLTKALRHVRGHLFSVESCGDFITLGFGPLIFGTADGGVHTPAAGWVGFHRPSTTDATQAEKIVGIPYRFQWLLYGDIGDHITPMSRGLATHVLAPLLIGDQALLTASVAPQR